MKRIFLIDCPGVVVNSVGDTEEDSVLKGVVRAERLPDPTEWIPAILRTVKRSYVAACYGLPEKGEGTWKDDTDLLEKVRMQA
jgi:nuclear GTP-binding protein